MIRTGGDMGLFSTPKIQQPKPTPVTPRLSDTEMKSRDETAALRKRRGIEDQILSLGRQDAAGADGTPRYARLLGRSGQ